MCKLDRTEMVLQKLREQGLRITSQRRALVSIILENQCATCKEIYYEARKENLSVGIATVYRMVKTLEELALIDKNHSYNISYENLAQKNRAVFVTADKQQVLQLDKEEWFGSLQESLKNLGLIQNDGSFTVIIKEHNASERWKLV